MSALIQLIDTESGKAEEYECATVHEAVRLAGDFIDEHPGTWDYTLIIPAPYRPSPKQETVQS